MGITGGLLLLSLIISVLAQEVVGSFIVYFVLTSGGSIDISCTKFMSKV